MSENKIRKLQKKAEMNPEIEENWLALIDAQFTARVDYREIANTFL